MKIASFEKILNNLIEYLLYFLIFFLPFSKASIEVFSSLIIFFYFIKKGLFFEWRSLNKPILISLFFFSLFMALSLTNSGIYISKSISLLILRWLKNIFLFLAISEIFVDSKKMNKAVFAFLSSAFILVLDGIFQKIVGFDCFWSRPLVDVGRGLTGITGTFQHYNSFGSFLGVSMLLSMSLYLKTDLNKSLKWLVTGFFLLAGLCFYWTFSRGSWVSFFIGILLMLIISRRFKVAILFFAIFLLGLFFVPEAKDRFLFIFQTGGDQGRFALWKAAWHMVKENPYLGKGLGTYMKILPHYAPELGLQYTHNSYLQILAETGIFSLMSFLCFIIILLYQSAKKLFKNSDDSLLLGFFCMFFSFLINCIFDNQLYSLQLSSLFWILAACLNSLIQKKRQ